MVAHSDIDHTGLTGVGGASGIIQFDRVKLTSGDLTTSSTTFTDATGLSVTMTTEAHRVMVAFVGWGNTTGTGTICADLAVDGTRQGGTFGLIAANVAGNHSSLSFVWVTDVLSAASHTFKIQFRNSEGAATSTLFASAVSPATIQVIETGLTA